MKTSGSSLCSLADREDNEGVEWIDVRVVEAYSGRDVDFRGKWNHEITSIPLWTAGGATSTISNEFMLIMQECACHSKNNDIHSSPQIQRYANIVDDSSVEFGGG